MWQMAFWIVGLTSAAFVPITTRICVPTPQLIGAPGAARFSAPTQSSVGDETEIQRVPAPVFALNSATKWLVVAAQTTAVVTRRDLVSPYIVIGSIVASFGTAALKRLIGQQRPAGSPFTDPGMPSSHALVGTFAAVGWAVHLRAPLATFWLLLSAAVIALLRVAVGYHTWAQVIVGSTLGATTACAWMAAGAALAPRIPRPAALRVVYAIYVLGSALFIGRKMATWPGSERRRTRGGAPSNDQRFADGSLARSPAAGAEQAAVVAPAAEAGSSHPCTPKIVAGVRNDNVPLMCPYGEKDDVKQLGGLWNNEERRWYVPAGLELAPFSRWNAEAFTYLRFEWWDEALRSQIKTQGAEFDGKTRRWYVRGNTDLRPFARWCI